MFQHNYHKINLHRLHIITANEYWDSDSDGNDEKKILALQSFSICWSKIQILS